MSTFAAGRWKTPGRKTVESCPVLDVNQLSAMGYLQPGWAGQWVVGSNGAGSVVSISTHAEARRLNLSWPSYITAGDGQDGGVTERISIVQVPSNLGRGSLPYFVCPGEGATGCGREYASCTSRAVISSGGIAFGSSTPANPNNRGDRRSGAPTSCASASASSGHPCRKSPKPCGCAPMHACWRKHWRPRRGQPKPAPPGSSDSSPGSKAVASLCSPWIS